MKKSKTIALSVLLFVVALLIGIGVYRSKGNSATDSAKTSSIDLHDLLKWPRMKADEFGCFLEQNYEIRDNKFNCSLKDYKNAGDPCKDDGAYTEGPQLPEDFASRLSPDLASIGLSWEHGELQSVALWFKKPFPRPDLEQRFGYHEPIDAPNLQSFSTEGCSPAGTCLTLEGFDHIGAGDVDCGN